MNETNMEKIFTDALFDILYFGNGFQDMLSLAETYIHSLIFFYDLNYNLIASSPQGNEHSEHLHKTRTHSYLNETATNRMEKYQVLKDLNLHKDAFIASDKDNPLVMWLLCAVRIKGSFVGYIISQVAEENSQKYLKIFSLLARALSVELQKNEAYTYKTGIKYSFFLNNLLNGEFETEEEIRTRLQILGREIGQYHHVICISAVDSFGDNDFHRSVDEQARQCFSNCISIKHDGNMVLFITDKNRSYENASYFQGFIRFLKTHRLVAGISNVYTNALDTRGAYECAVAVLEAGIVMHLPEQLYFTKDLAFYQILRQCDISMLNQMISPEIKEIERYDLENHSHFIETLQMYFRCSRNTSLAAQMSELHRTTYFYRIKAIEERFSIDLSDAQMLFSLEMSLKIRDYLMVISSCK